VLNLLDAPIPACFGERSEALLPQLCARFGYADKTLLLFRICIYVATVRTATLRILVLRAFYNYNLLYDRNKRL
jgi:hypothetical protein